MKQIINTPKNEKELLKNIKYSISKKIKLNFNEKIKLINKNNIHLNKLNKIKEFDKKENLIIVESGASIKQINNYLNKSGYFLPIENKINTNDSIAQVFMRGDDNMYNQLPHSKHSILGSEMILSDIKNYNFGGKFIKNVTGYDFNRLLYSSNYLFSCPKNFTIRIYKKNNFEEFFIFKSNRINDLLSFLNSMKDIKPEVTNFIYSNNRSIIEIKLTALDRTILSNKKRDLINQAEFFNLKNSDSINFYNKTKWALFKINCLSDKTLKYITKIIKFDKNISIYSHIFKGQIYCLVDKNSINQFEKFLRQEYLSDNLNYNIIDSDYKEFGLNHSSLSYGEEKLIKLIKKNIDECGIFHEV